jgi:hypothetical protein
MVLDDVLAGTKKFIAVIADSIDDLSFDASDKNRAAAGCLQISIEHHASIELLVENVHHRGSAAALVRPQLEAFLRGAWLHRCATEQAATDFLNDKNPPGPTALIVALEQNEFFKNGALSMLKQKLWDGLCSYTHAGGLHVARRIAATEIVANYSDEEMIEMFEVCNLVALMASYEISEIAKSTGSSNPIYVAYKEIPKRP